MIHEVLTYLLIFIISSIFPIYLLRRFKLYAFICILISLVSTIVLMNLYFLSPLPKGRFGEVYEVFWLVPALFVLIVNIYLSKKRKRKLS